MDNQTNIDGQSQVVQPLLLPHKPKINYWMLSTVFFACLFFIFLAINFFSWATTNKQKDSTITATETTDAANGRSPSMLATLEATKFAYVKTATEEIRGPGEIIISNFDGSTKQNIQTVPIYVGPYGSYDVSEKDEKLIYKSFIEKDQYGNGIEEYVWMSDKGSEPRKILSPKDMTYIESPRLSADGQKIAYSLVTENGQLWTMNSDGSENKLVIDRTRDYLGSNSRFRLAPVEWSQDNTKIYLQATSDSEATPIGLYVANLLTGKIEKANTPQVTLWGLSFSPDKTKIAYTTFEWLDVADRRPEPSAPFIINVTDLNTGETVKILESKVDQFDQPVWSSDGSQLSYKILGKSIEGGDQGIYVVDIQSKSSKLVTTGTRNSRLKAWGWLSSSKLIYSEESFTTGVIPNQVTSYLFTINTDGTDKQKIDSAREITVFGTLR